MDDWIPDLPISGVVFYEMLMTFDLMMATCFVEDDFAFCLSQQ